MKTELYLTVNLSERLEHGGFYRRTLEDLALTNIESGQSLYMNICLDPTIKSGATLRRAMLVFSEATPLRDDFGRPVYEVDFKTGDRIATWHSQPINQKGEFHYYLWVELEEDPATPNTGNRIVVAYPEMVVSDDPPISSN